ncbi:unnamed protein product, partial [Anisakis simplex]|uniref:Reverse transcriptase domain-containing protein n=1 Tax=Anisakis simplex TaxID=6269 RepID=A0A0M3JZN0_ANISI
MSKQVIRTVGPSGRRRGRPPLRLSLPRVNVVDNGPRYSLRNMNRPSFHTDEFGRTKIKYEVESREEATGRDNFRFSLPSFYAELAFGGHCDRASLRTGRLKRLTVKRELRSKQNTSQEVVNGRSALRNAHTRSTLRRRGFGREPCQSGIGRATLKHEIDAEKEITHEHESGLAVSGGTSLEQNCAADLDNQPRSGAAELEHSSANQEADFGEKARTLTEDDTAGLGEARCAISHPSMRAVGPPLEVKKFMKPVEICEHNVKNVEEKDSPEYERRSRRNGTIRMSRLKKPVRSLWQRMNCRTVDVKLSPTEDATRSTSASLKRAFCFVEEKAEDWKHIFNENVMTKKNSGMLLIGSDRPSQHRKTTLAICTYNCRSLAGRTGLTHLMKELKKIKCDVLGLCETRRKEELNARWNDGSAVRLGKGDGTGTVG